MAYNIDQLLSDTIAKQYAPSELDKEQLGALWKNTAVFVRDNLSSKKSVKLSDLGTFGFTEQKQNGKVSLQAKFLVSPPFAKAYGISTQTGAILQKGVPVVEVNFAAISVQSGICRDALIASIKGIIKTLGEAVKSGNKASIELTHLGKLTVSKTGCVFKFDDAWQKKREMSLVVPVKVQTASEKPTPKSSSPPAKAETPKTALDLSERFNSQRPANAANGLRSTKNSPTSEMEEKKKEDTVKDFAATLTQNPKANVFVATGITAAPDICENCRVVEERELLGLAEKEIERKIAEDTIRQDNEFRQKEKEKYLKTKNDRKEADAVNLANRTRTKEPVEGLGFLLEGRKEPVPDHDKKRQYKEDILQQARERKEKEQKEIEEQKKKEKEDSERISREVREQEKKQVEERREKNKVFQQYLLDQINGKSEWVPAQLGVEKDTQFMARTLSTPQRVAKEKEDARKRKQDQLDVIHERQRQKDEEKAKENEWAIAERKAIEEQLRKEKKEDALKKKRQQEETKEALLKQIKEKEQFSKENEGGDFLEIGEAEKLALKAHAKKCGRCGRLMEEMGVTKLAKLKRQGALHQKDSITAS